MPTPGRRKQRYVLDIDDVVREGFMTQANAEALVRGINESGGTVKLAVPFGGTNNDVYIDQQLLRYNALTNKIESAGITGVLPGGQSVFIPRETQILYRDSFTDTTVTDTVEMEIARHSFNRPSVNHVWSEVMVVAHFSLDEFQPSITGLRVVLNDSALIPVGWVSPPPTQNYQAVGGDTQSITWIGMGPIPDSMAFDDVLAVSLLGVPQDIAAERTVITRVSARGLVPEPPVGGQKGVPIFFDDPPYVYNGNGPVPWTTYDITMMVPETASAVIIQTGAQSEEQGGSQRIVYYRREAGAHEYVLSSVKTNDDEDDTNTNHTQQILPFRNQGGVRSFDYNVTAHFNHFVWIRVIGYIT